MSDNKRKPLSKDKLTAIDSHWGEKPTDHFGYASDEERRATRGMEDWELLESIPESQKPIPKWFYGVIITVLLLSIGLSFPYWGDRVGYERDWLDWGYAVAFVYLLVASIFVYYMVKMYGSKVGGRLDEDHSDEEQSQDKEEK